MPVAQVKAGPEQLGDPASDAHGPAGSHRLHLVAVPQQVLQTLLVPCALEPSALTALAGVDIELPASGLPGDFDRELLGDVVGVAARRRPR
jgi:hypothetical protein